MSLSKEQVFSISNNTEFNAAALQVFRHQAANCAVYSNLSKDLKLMPTRLAAFNESPFYLSNSLNRTQ